MMALIAASPRIRRTLRPLIWMLGIEASLIRPPPSLPPPVVENEGAGITQETTDAVFVAAPLISPSYPPGSEAPGVVPGGQVLHPEIFSRA
jgi:hypothetical protein